MDKEQKLVNWSAFMGRAYLAYQVMQGRSIERQQFAKFLGIDPTILSQWTGGIRYPANIERLDAVAAKMEVIDDSLRRMGHTSNLRVEAYNALGFAPRMPRNRLLQSAITDLEHLPPDVQDYFVKAIGRTAEQRGGKINLPALFPAQVLQS